MAAQGFSLEDMREVFLAQRRAALRVNGTVRERRIDSSLATANISETRRQLRLASLRLHQGQPADLPITLRRMNGNPRISADPFQEEAPPQGTPLTIQVEPPPVEAEPEYPSTPGPTDRYSRIGWGLLERH